MWSRHFRRFAFALFFGIQNALGSLVERSRGGMDPNGKPGDDGGD